ncbi:intraflagellar transport protein 25 homolog [Brachionichthys hirsutus]|uniref:intraflagellar transport protein 25 homolog n=1 Tax=Brachionichthys hirsutus TaxID=412623 RepID=UPI00360446C4
MTSISRDAHWLTWQQESLLVVYDKKAFLACRLPNLINMVSSSPSALGGTVVFATSSDHSHPPANVIDGDTETFWMSTGMFPQQVTIRFEKSVTLTELTVESYNVKHLKIEECTAGNPSNFQHVTDKEFERTEGHLQSNSILLKGSSATHLRLTVTAGYDAFISMHRAMLH